MSEMGKPNLGEDLVRVHMIITRGLDVSIEEGTTFAEEGFPDEEIALGYRSYARALLSFVSAHHLSEDEVAFPYFQERIPEMPFERLQAEHEEIEGLLEQAQETLEGLDEEPERALRGLGAHLRTIREMWHSHIGIEEEHWDPQRLAEMMEPEEHQKISGQLAKVSMDHAEPLELVVPFALHNLPATDREALESNMPPKVVNELVPGPWKEAWAPMKPFLLV